MTSPERQRPKRVGEPVGDKVAPYNGLAEIYDFVMRHVDYVHWANHVHTLLRRYDAPAGPLAEFACGTGNITVALADLGHEIAGFDMSPAMIRVAAAKEAPPTFAVRDLRDLAGLGPFAAALCLYDSLNYLLSLDDLACALDQVHGVLVPGGLFIFDVCTERNSVQHFRDVRDTEHGPGFRYARHSFYDADEGLQFNAFDIRLDDGRRRQETHVQRIYPHHEIVGAIDASPFQLLAALDGFGLEPGSERSDRVHFVLQATS